MSIRLNILSEIALEAGQPRPIHMFRPGTFTDMNGNTTSFSLEDVAGIVQRFAANRRRKPPITERHDFGRAIGRLQDVYADAQGNLYGLPKWNDDGRTLLQNEVYDGFSCELDHDDGGWRLIGGSLTNYPAVGGLEPVVLSAPPIVTAPSMPVPTATPAPVPAHPDTTPKPSQGVPPMSEETTMLEEQIELPEDIDPATRAQVDAVLSQRLSNFENQKRLIERQVRAEMERKFTEERQRAAIASFALNAVTATSTEPYAIACKPEELEQLLLATPVGPRNQWIALLNRMRRGDGLLSFDEIGSSGEGHADQWTAIVDQKVNAGFSRVEAIKQASKEHPELYAAQSYSIKKGGR